MMAWAFERVAEGAGTTGGGVVWDGEGVVFTRPAENVILRWAPNCDAEPQVLRRWSCGADGLALGPGGVLFSCQSTSRRLARLEPDGSATVLPYRLDGAMHNFPRDLSVDASGAIWFSDRLGGLTAPGPQIYPFLDHASVLRLSPADGGWHLERMTFDTTAPSGVLAHSSAGLLFVGEGRELRAYPMVGDRLGAAAVVHRFGARVDGLCLTGDGALVVAAGPQVGVLDAGGALRLSQTAPAELVGCTVGGLEGQTLFLTSSTGELWQVRDVGLAG